MAILLKQQRKNRAATDLARYLRDPVGFVEQRLLGFRVRWLRSCRHERINRRTYAANLSLEYLRSLRSLPEKQRKRFFEGKYVAELDSALWTYELIESCRLNEGEALPEFKQITVGPSGASGTEDRRFDEIGIVVVGLIHDDIGIVLEDCSVRDGPHGWSRRAVAFRRWKADRIVAEINFGGAMVEFVLNTADKDVSVRVNNASRGKHVRAELVSALYENRKIRHAGRFPDLEDQLTNFASSGYVGERSPDRGDALVWAITDLMIDAEPVFDASYDWACTDEELEAFASGTIWRR
jgi:phage terminase large subunit-like protein